MDKSGGAKDRAGGAIERTDDVFDLVGVALQWNGGAKNFGYFDFLKRKKIRKS